MKLKDINKRALIYLILVLALSIINFHNIFFGINVSSLLNSVIGLTGIALFFIKKKIALPLLQFWAYSQIIIVAPFWEAWQVFNTSVYMAFTLHSGFRLQLGINFLGIFYTGLFYFLYKFSIIDKEIKLSPIQWGEMQARIMPVKYKILKEIIIEEKQWFLIKQINEDEDFGIISSQNTNRIKFKKGDKYIFRKIDNIDEIDRLISTSNLKGGFVRMI